jgi:hypothetical protein
MSWDEEKTSMSGQIARLTNLNNAKAAKIRHLKHHLRAVVKKLEWLALASMDELSIKKPITKKGE